MACSQSSWPIWLLLVLFTVIAFLAVGESEAGRAELFVGWKGAAARAASRAVAQSIGSLGCLAIGGGAMVAFALWLVIRTSVPHQDRLAPVAAGGGEAAAAAPSAGPDG